MANVTGWGRGTWGSALWSEPTPVVPTGIQSSTDSGSTTVSADANFTLTGIQAGSSVGDVSVKANADAYPHPKAQSRLPALPIYPPQEYKQPALSELLLLMQRRT